MSSGLVPATYAVGDHVGTFSTRTLGVRGGRRGTATIRRDVLNIGVDDVEEILSVVLQLACGTGAIPGECVVADQLISSSAA